MQKIETGANWYRHLYDHIPSICFTLDLATAITDINLFGSYSLGYSPEELESKSLLQIVHTSDKHNIQNVFEDFLNRLLEVNLSWQNTRCKCRLVCKNGSDLLVKMNVLFIPEYYSESKIVIICEDIDIEEETELKEFEQLYQTILGNISEIVFLTDLDGKLIFVSPNVEMVFGYSLPEVQQMENITQLIGKKWENLSELENGIEIKNVEIQIVEKSGNKRCLLINVKLVDFKGKTVLYNCLDVTNHKQLEERFPINQEEELSRFKVVGININSDQKKAEEALNILSNAVEQTADNAIITDKIGTIEYVNSAFEKLTGYAKSEAIGKTPAILKSGQHKPNFYHELWENILSGNVFRAEFINRKKNGELFYEEKTITPIKNYLGEITHFVSTGKDITDRIKAEAALRESQAKYKALFEIFPIGISITDEAGNIIEFNQESQNILSIDAEEYLTRKCDEDRWKIVKKDGTKMPVGEFASVIALQEKKLVKNVEMGILKASNQITWLNVNAVPIPLPGYGVAIAYTDITEIKNSSVELEKSFSLLRATLESTDDGIVAFSVDNKIIIFNQKIIEMWQIKDGIMSSQSNKCKLRFAIKQLRNPEKLIGRLKECRSEPETKGYDILELKNGKIFEQYTQPQKIGDKIVGRVWSFRDITEQKRAEESLRQQAERERLLGRMAERIRRSLNLMEILNTTVAEVRQFLQTDRVLIYRFYPDWSGVVVVESVDEDWIPILGTTIVDPCFGANLIQPYQQGRINGIEDIYNANVKQCYLNLLAQFQVRANLVVPILQGEELWGLLIAHHCKDARKWQDLEIDLLKQLATQVAIAIQQAELYQKLEKANQELQRLASLDGLTQLANRRRFDEYLTQEWERLLLEHAPLSLILCDVDCFKLYNDTYGHVAGDLCLQQVASAIRDVVRRPIDLVARYGGEEFAVILPNTTDVGAALVAKAILEKIRSLCLTHAASWVKEYVTLSLGVATTFPQWEFSPEQLIAIADNALYQAKRQGRDRFLLSQLG